MKNWLRELAEAVIPPHYYNACIQNATNPQGAIDTINCLPGENKGFACESVLESFFFDCDSLGGWNARQ